MSRASFKYGRTSKERKIRMACIESHFILFCSMTRYFSFPWYIQKKRNVAHPFLYTNEGITARGIPYSEVPTFVD